MASIPASQMSFTALVVKDPEPREPMRVEGVLDLAVAWPGAGPTVVSAVTDFFGNGGQAALVVTVTDQASAVQALTAWNEGGDQVRLVALDPALSADGAAALESWCEAAGALLVLDAWPGGTLPDGAGAHAAVYYPPLTGEDGTARPAGPAMAGVLARVAAARGPWTAPAGREHAVLGAAGLAVPLDTQQIAALTEAHVNVLRVLPGERLPIAWGARTASFDAEWKYVNVRRLLLFLEHSIDAGLQWVVFEPNGPPLWQEVRREAEEFLVMVWRLGGIQGSKVEEAFFVRCDASTMTQADLDDGRLVCEIGVAPVRPAEFVILRFSLTTAARGDSHPPP